MKNMYVIGGSASINIAEELASMIGASMANIASQRFPDGEFYFRILDDVKEDEVLIVQTTYPDQNLVELLLIQSALKEAGAKKITVVIPYYGYARQDTKFNDGEAISAKAIAKLISLNADQIITVDPHKEHILGFFSVPALSCTAIPEIAKYLKQKNIDMVLAPDKGALEKAKQTSNIINCDFDYMEKTRIDGSTVEMKPKKLNAEGKTVAIVDDIISTGGTMALAIKQLKKNKAEKVFVACTHGLFADEAIRKLTDAKCDEIISTDTINSKYSKVKIASAIARHIL